MFLLGGPAFSGKTLLAHLMNQGEVTCLDEPDFDKPHQRHRGIPFLQELFPEAALPACPTAALSCEQAVDLMLRCEGALAPRNLGIKTANATFLEYARVFKQRGYPVIGLVRDIRDTLVEAPLPRWLNGEQSLNDLYRSVWHGRNMFDLLLRYEDLVTNPQGCIAQISRLLAVDLVVRLNWPADSVHHPMFKLDRHEMLRSGVLVTTQVGIWRSARHRFSSETLATARMMGY